MTQNMKHYLIILSLFALSNLSGAVPKKYESDGYFQQNGDQVAMESAENNTTREQRSGEPSKEPKFGFLTYGTTAAAQGYGTTGLGAPIKLDLGGVVLGALIGLGAVLILPKLIHVFAEKPSYYEKPYDGYGGPYGRSERSHQSSTNISQILTKVDESLSKYNIDSSSCMQRAICSYVKNAVSKVAEGTASSIDSIVESATSNAVLNFMLDGSSLKQAVDLGKQGGNCGAKFSKCSLDKDAVYSALKNLMAE